MARPIVLCNGELNVGINMYGLVHDFSYPHVGKENHTIGSNLRHRIGVWVEGVISWLDDGSWTHDFEYVDDTLVGAMVARNQELGIELRTTDFVHAEVSMFVRSIKIKNLSDQPRDIRLFMHQAFVIGDTRSNTDTAQYLPDSHAVVHYRGRRVFVVSGSTEDGAFDQHSIGLFGIEGRQGTWHDAIDGELSGCMVEHGRVDSTIRYAYTIEAGQEVSAHYWIAAGTSFRDALLLHRKMHEHGPEHALAATTEWWKAWMDKTHHAASVVPEKYQRLFKISSLVVKSQIDKHGAIIASTDSGLLNYGRDAYGYTWPRDGAYAVWPLMRLGYKDEVINFFNFCRRGMHPKGYLKHKYFADGSLGSSWHAYVHENGVVAPPIQEDETALTVFVFAQYYHIHKDEKLLRDYYESMIKPMAEFLAEYIDPETSLPRPTYDLWEEVFLTTTYTTAVTYAALLAAADLADEIEDSISSVKWRSVAEDIHSASRKYLFNDAKQSFYRGIRAHKGTIEYNNTIDASSVFGAFMFGLFDVHSEEITGSIRTLREMYMSDGGCAIPRYENDAYCRPHQDAPSNYWHITTLWYAQYCIETGDIGEAQKVLDWVVQHAYPSGVLAEQINPRTGNSESVAPLTWSHAEFIATLLDYVSELRDNK